MTIEIGVVVEQNASLISAYTFINKSIPATGSGTITAVSFYVKTQVTGLVIAIFEEVSANHFTARSQHALGTKAAGIHTDVAVSMAVEAGDFIGYYYETGAMYNKSHSFEGVAFKAGDQTECVNTEFTIEDPDGGLYLHGTGELPAAVAGGGGPAPLLLAQGEI